MYQAVVDMKSNLERSSYREMKDSENQQAKLFDLMEEKRKEARLMKSERLSIRKDDEVHEISQRLSVVSGNTERLRKTWMLHLGELLIAKQDLLGNS